MMSPTTFAMAFLLSISILIILSSNSMFSMWLALEVNTISFTTLIHLQKTKESAESCMKYFLPQALSSSIFIFSAFLLSFSSEWITPMLISFFAMTISLGLAPFHHWFPNVASLISWEKNVILMTVQKFPPLCVIFHTSIPPSMTLPSILSSILLGPLGGLSQTNLKTLLAFSSITHMGWMLTASIVSNMLCTTYLMLYSILITSLIVSIKKKINSLNQLLFCFNNTQSKILFTLLLLSLAGLPPMTGFFPKWLVISLSQNPPLIILLILSALLNLFFYLRLLYPFLFLFSSISCWSPPQQEMKAPSFLWISLFLLPMSAPLSILFY